MKVAIHQRLENYWKRDGAEQVTGEGYRLVNDRKGGKGRVMDCAFILTK